MTAKPRPSSVPKPICPRCERPLAWLTRQLSGRFCSKECEAKDREVITKAAMERLKAAIPKSPQTTAARRRGALLLAPRPEESVS